MRKTIKNKDTREYHGYAGTPTYVSWQEMRKRCYDKSVIRYPEYGGRGIRVCIRWKESFGSFLADMGERPTGCTLGRVDGNKDYYPDNCRWERAKEQARNKRNTRYVECDGETKSLGEWAERVGITTRLLRQRLTRDKMTPEQALRKKR